MSKIELFIFVLVAIFGITTYLYYSNPEVLQNIIDLIYQVPDTIDSHISNNGNIIPHSSYSTIKVQITNSIYKNNVSCSSILSRYDIDYALKCMLTGENRSAISPYANKLKSTSKVHTVWNILKFVDENIEYDKEKESKLPIVYKIYPGGRVEIVSGRDAYIQTPYETIQRGKGICSDYTMLILALLLESGFDTVYAMEIDGSSDGHIVPVVKLNKWYFVLDQRLPPMDFEGFVSTYNGEIREIYWYEIHKDGDTVDIKKSKLNVMDLLKEKYEATASDFEPIRDKLNIKISNKYKINIDSKLLAYFNKDIPTVKYNKILRASITFKKMARIYHPLFEDEYVDYIYEQMFKMSKIDLDGLLNGAKGVYVSTSINGDDLIVNVYIGI